MPVLTSGAGALQSQEGKGNQLGWGGFGFFVGFTGGD